MSELLACPFCRTLYTRGETQSCPECDVPLKPLWDLPPSYETTSEALSEWEQTHPADRRLPLRYLGRGRGLFFALSILGLASYTLPWLVLSAPEVRELSGLALIRARGFWFSGGGVGFLVLLAVVVSRRSVSAMRGSRLIVAILCACPVLQALVLTLHPPSRALVPVSYHWGAGFYLAAALGALGVGLSPLLGGRIDDLPADLGRELRPGAQAETSSGQTVH